MRLRRSELSTPGSNERMIQKAAESNADLVFLDLEDAVAPSEKVAARAKVVAALQELDWGKKTVGVRINGLDTEWAYEGVIQVVEGGHRRLDVLIIPKVKTAADVRWVDVLLSQIEAKLKTERRIGLEAIIEDVEALVNVVEIARSSPRLEALILGFGDYSASQGIIIDRVREYPGDIWHYARNQVVVAARLAGIDAIDGPYADFRDPEGYRREATLARILGFVGKWAIHPSQIDIANEVYSPTEQEMALARKIVDAYEQAQREGVGAIAVDGRLIDAATIRIMQNILAKAEAIEASSRP